jgi:hypothetical protein
LIGLIADIQSNGEITKRHLQDNLFLAADAGVISLTRRA